MVDFPVPKLSRQPRKWSRRDGGPIPNRWVSNRINSNGNEEEEGEYLDESDLGCLAHDDDLDCVDLPEPGSVIVFDPREPWGGWNVRSSTNDSKPFMFSGKKNQRKSHNYHRIQDHGQQVKMITLMPDAEIEPVEDGLGLKNRSRSRQLIESMTMIADMELKDQKTRFYLLICYFFRVYPMMII